MTVEQLIRKLKRFPQDATVYVDNDYMYREGTYKVTSSEVDYCDVNNTVVIGTDYKDRK